MAENVVFKNRPLKVITDEDINWNIYVPDYKLEPYREFDSDKYYLSFYIEEFPNGYGYGWDSNIISSKKTYSNCKNYSSPEKAYIEAIKEIYTFYDKPHYKMQSLRRFLEREIQPNNLFSFDYT